MRNRFKIEMLATTRAAFTLVELLAIIALLALGVLLLIPAFAHTHPNVESAQCLNSMRQLMAGMTMYTHDNTELFPPNPDASYTGQPGCNWVMGNASGWMPSQSAGGSVDAGNPAYLTNPAYDLLASYIGTNASLFRCPFDPRICPYTGTDSTKLGTSIPVVRSISMNGGVGTRGNCLSPGNGNVAVDGPWLNGSHSHTANNPYKTFGKMTDFRNTRPSEIWVLADDDPWTINDAVEAVVAISPDAIDYCSAMNGNATAFAFADSHSEIHKWKSDIWIHTGIPSRATFQSKASSGLGYQDWFWWASHATRNTVSGTVP
jgi:competence protein ComGC